MPPILTLRDIHHGFGGTPCLAGVGLSVEPRDRVCLVGRNGSGKSTLLRIAAGLIEPADGERFVQPGTTMRYLPQEPDLTAFATTLDYVLDGLGPNDDPHRATTFLGDLGLTGAEGTRTLSGGEARRAALARVLAPAPDLLLLDEPTNHLDLPAIEWLEATLAGLRSALVLISHDRRFLERLSRRTVWLDRGTARALDQGFAAFEAWRDETYAQEERERHKLDRKIAMEEDWLRYGVTARRKRNVRRLGDLTELRRAAREHRGATGDVRLTVSEAESRGKLVIEASGVSKSFGEQAVVRDFALRIAQGDRLGIVGANGAGKTTLLKLLIGSLEPDAGSVRIADTIAMATLDQGRESIDPRWTLADAMTDGRGDTIEVGGRRKHVMSYLKDFLFAPEQARTPVAVLSGGERGRLMLARALAKPSNLLVLDEPTNDLDLETLDLLQEMLGDYAGTVILVSHDRDFLDRVVTSVVMSEGQGRWQVYAGGYSDMLVQRGAGVAGRRKPDAATAERRLEATVAQLPRPVSRARLSYRDKHALETLPATMEALKRDIVRIEAALGAPDLYATDRDRFEKLGALLGTARTKLEAAEDEWLRLELLREELEP